MTASMAADSRGESSPQRLGESPLCWDESPAALASRLFALSVELESLLLSRKRGFHAAVDRFLEEVESRKTRISFSPQVVTQSVEYDERVPGFYTLFLGFFGYERRVKKVRLVYTQQLQTQEIALQLHRFISEGRDSFDAKVEAFFDVDGLVRECAAFARDKLEREDAALLKAALRRAFSRVAAVPLKIRAPEQPPKLLTDPGEIVSTIERAQKELERLSRTFLSRANSARNNIESGLAMITAVLKEELVKAFLERKAMERQLEQSLSEQAILPKFDEPRRALSTPSVGQSPLPENYSASKV